MSAMTGKSKPSSEEIARLRTAAAAKKATAPQAASKKPAPEKKRGDPAEEALALAAFFGDVGEVVDIGTNLQTRCSLAEVERLLERCGHAGVGRVVLTGCDVPGSQKGADYCERYSGKNLYCTAGVHPHDATKFNDNSLAKLRILAQSEHCVAVGECGLDYDRMFSPRETQLAVFEAQARLAVELSIPLFVHVREVEDPEKEKFGAYAEAIAVLAKVNIDPSTVVVHCFTGDGADFKMLRRYGCKIGLTGFIGIAKRAQGTIAALKEDGLEALLNGELMLETDAPFMLPDKNYLPTPVAKKIGIRGGKNEPAVTPAVARALAAAISTDVTAVTAQEVARHTTKAANAFFRFK